MINNIFNFKKMNLREQVMFTALALVIIYGLYTQIVGRPLTMEKARLRTQKDKYLSKIKDLQKSFPDVDQARQKVVDLKDQIKEMSSTIDGMEGKLIGENDIDRLISEISKSAAKVNLTSLKQEIKKDGDYSTLYVELEFAGVFVNCVDYLYSLECLGDFVKVEKLEIIKPQEKIGTLLTGCVLSMPIGKTSTRIEFGKAKDELKMTKDIFGLPVNVMVVSDIGLKLEGITYSKTNPMALINGQVATIGADVEGYVIKNILIDRVIVEKDGKIFTLAMERGR